MSQENSEQQEPVLEPVVEVVEQVAPKLGGILKDARIAQKISVSEVSQALKFSARQIESLESDDYSKLQGNTFLRGFVRTYARFLKLDDAKLLSLLEPKVELVPEVIQPESLDYEMPSQASATSTLLKKLLILLLFVALAAAGWYGWNWRQNQPKASEVVSSESVSKPIVSTLAPTVMVAPPQPLVQAEPAPSSGNQVAVAAAPVAGVPAAVSPVTVTPLAQAETAQRQLTFVLGGDAWLEVRDASRKVVLTGKYPANSRLVANGLPPFQLVVGNAMHVRVQMNERNIDLSPYIRADVARLTVADEAR